MGRQCCEILYQKIVEILFAIVDCCLKFLSVSLGAFFFGLLYDCIALRLNVADILQEDMKNGLYLIDTFAQLCTLVLHTVLLL